MTVLVPTVLINKSENTTLGNFKSTELWLFRKVSSGGVFNEPAASYVDVATKPSTTIVSPA